MTMTSHEHPSSMVDDRGQRQGDHPRGPRRVWLTVAVVAFVALVASVAFLVGRESVDENATTTTAKPTTTVTTPSTSAPPTTAPTTASTAPNVDTSTAVWPTVASGIQYTDPVAAARGFAEDFVGFTDPIVGAFQQGDSRSGEVEVRANATGPVTTVFVRQLSGRDDWWVLGAATANIRLDEPTALAEVSSPVRLQGTSTAFEANVSVDIRQDGSDVSIGQGFVMGGSMGELGPFDGTVSFDPPAAVYGAIVLYTRSMENGAVWEASVVRIRFATN